MGAIPYKIFIYCGFGRDRTDEEMKEAERVSFLLSSHFLFYVCFVFMFCFYVLFLCFVFVFVLVFVFNVGSHYSL